MTSAAAPAATAGTGATTFRRDDATWPVLVVCLACGFTTLLDSAVVNIAVPSLRASLHASAAESQWILASYSLTFGLALVPAGRLGDLLGRRTLLLAGVGVFAVMSLLSGLAVEPWMVIVARLTQGAGAGTISSQVLGLIQDTFSDTRRAKALGYYSVVTSLSGIAGPLLAGGAILWLGDDQGWRVALLLCLPVAAATFLYGWRRLPAPPPRPVGERRPPLDLVALGLLAVATLLLVWPFIGGSSGLGSIAPYVGAAALVGAGFVAWERHRDAAGRPALLPGPLRRARLFTLGTAVAMFWFASALGQMTVISLYLIESLGIEPLAVAAISLGSSFGMGIASFHAWRFVARFGRRGVTACMVVAAVAILAVVAATFFVDGRALIGVIVPFQFVSGLASGCFEAPNRTLTLAHTPPGSNGVAAGILQLSQRLASVISIAAVTAWSFTADGSSGSAPIRNGLLLCAALTVTAAGLSLYADHVGRRTP